MSVKVLTAVFEHSEARGNDRLVLLALADYASDESWSCWPSVKSIAGKARVSERTAQRCLKSLREGGHIATLGRVGDGSKNVPAHRYATNRYMVLRPWDACQTDTRQPDTPDNLTGDSSRVEGCQDARSGVTLLTPEPSLEPSVEPSGASAAPKRRTTASRGTRCPDPFFVTGEMRGWSTTATPDIDVAEHTRRFVDHWRAQPGAKGVKLDWEATWRNWMRREQDRAQPRAGPRTRSEKQADAAREVLGQYAAEEAAR